MPFIEPLIVSLLNELMGRRPTTTTGRDGLTLGQTTRLDGKALSVSIAEARRSEHVVIIGKTGTGKTHLLQSMAGQLMARGEPLCFIDFHGDATAALVRLASQYTDAGERLIIVDPTEPHHSPGLNPLEVRGSDE